MSVRRAAFAFIFVTVLLDMLALGIIVPVLPQLVVQFRGGNTASGAAIYGVFGTVWAAMQFLFSPVLGALSDRYGRRPVVLLSNFGLGLDYFVMALAPTLPWLFVGRVISGITAASYPTAGAYIADVTPAEQRAAKFGMLGAAFGVGFILGPAVGGVLGAISLRLPFWVAGGLSLANAAYGFFILPESLPLERRAPLTWRRANLMGSLTLLRSHQQLLGLAAVAFLYRLAHDSNPSIFVLYGNYRYGWDERTVGLVLALLGVCSLVVQAGMVGAIVARMGERRALLAGLLVGALAFGIYAAATTGAVFLVGVPIGALFGLAAPSMQGLMTRRVGPSEQGQLQGALNSVMGVAGLVAPLLFTQALAQGISWLGLPGAPYYLATLLLLLATVQTWRVTRPT